MLNENIKRIRKEKGFTQEELAVRLNVVRQTVSKWEKGFSVPDAAALQQIADVLEVSVQELLGGEPQAEAPENKNEIADQLSRINEQMAVRNRRSARIWKAIAGILLAIVLLNAAGIAARIFLSVKPQKAVSEETTSSEITDHMEEKAALPDTIDISGLSLSFAEGQLVCSFVPSIGDSSLEYEVSIHGTTPDSKSIEADVIFENGLLKASTSKSNLTEKMDYMIILTITNGDAERNVTVADSFSYEENGISWTSPWVK